MQLSDECDLICLQETFLHSDIPDALISGNGYQVFRRDRSGRIGGGVAILARRSLRCTPVSVPKGLEIVSIDVCSKTRSFRLINCYKPPNSKKTYVTNMNKCIQRLCKGSKIPIVVGDFNFPSLKGLFHPHLGPKQEVLSDMFESTMQDLSLEQLNPHPSREDCPNILDLVFCSSSLRHLFSEIECGPPLGGSDHFALSFTFRFDAPPISSHEKSTHRIFRKGNYIKANEYLSNVDWDLCLRNSPDIDSYFLYILYFLNSAVSSFVPLASAKPPPSLPYPVLRWRRRAKSLFAGRKTDGGRYRTALRSFHRSLRAHFASLEDGLLTSPNLRPFYDHVRKNTKSRDSEPDVMHEGSLITNPKRKSELFSGYFSSVYTKDNGKCPVLPVACESKLENVHISRFTVWEAIKSLKPTLSQGPCGIPAYFLKQVSASISQPLSTLFQWSLTTGSCPSMFQQSIVKPIWKKKGSKTDIENYRPITLCSSLAKVLEKIVTKEVLSHCQRNELISPLQFGFMPKRSLTTQLLLCLDDWTKIVSSKKSCFIVYLDFKKAFDTVCHTKLIVRLRSLGIDGNVLSWISNYLSNRTQRVSISGALSQPADVSSGTLQGSILGPIFYILYSSSLLDALSETDVSAYAYADDLKLYSDDPSKIQSALKIVESWCQEWQLSLSVHKCTVLLLGSSPETPLYLFNQVLPYSESVRDLGITMDRKLSFNEHCFDLAKRVKGTCYTISKCFTSGRVAPMVKAYLTYVRPKLESSCQVYNSVSEAGSRALESCQKLFTRLIFQKCRLRDRCYEDRLKFLGLSTLKERRFKLDLCLAHKIYHNQTFCNGLLVHKQQTRNLVHNYRLEQEVRTSTQRNLAFANRVCAAWNRLPDKVIESCPDSFATSIGI